MTRANAERSPAAHQVEISFQYAFHAAGAPTLDAVADQWRRQLAVLAHHLQSFRRRRCQQIERLARGGRAVGVASAMAAEIQG